LFPQPDCNEDTKPDGQGGASWQEKVGDEGRWSAAGRNAVPQPGSALMGIGKPWCWAASGVGFMAGDTACAWWPGGAGRWRMDEVDEMKQ